MSLGLPYYSCSSAKSIHSCFLYTTQGDAEDVELQESIYTNDTQGTVLYSWRETARKKKQFPSPNTLTGIQIPSSVIWIPIGKLNWLGWHMEHSCHYLFEWKAQDSPPHHHLMLSWDEQAIAFVHKSTLISSNHVHQHINTGDWLFVFSGSCFYKKQPQPLLLWAAIFFTEVWSQITYSTKFII